MPCHALPCPVRGTLITLSRSKPPLTAKLPLRCSREWFVAGTVRPQAWPCCAHPEPRARRRPPAPDGGTISRYSPQIWCSDASSPSAATGTVRLHAFSHARGLKLEQGSPRSSSVVARATAAPPLALPKPSPMPAFPAREWQGDSDLQLLHLIRLCLLCQRSLVFSIASSNIKPSVLGSYTARRYLHPPTTSHSSTPGAASLCIYRQNPIWNGRDPHSGLTTIRFASALVPNRLYSCASSSESAYFSMLTPPHLPPRHEH
jgi:hypothetical protein